MVFDQHTIEILSKHISVAHHIKGRVRFKVDPKIINYKDLVDIDELKTLEKSLKGIKKSSVNLLAKSLIVEYDQESKREELGFMRSRWAKIVQPTR